MLSGHSLAQEILLAGWPESMPSSRRPAPFMGHKRAMNCAPVLGHEHAFGPSGCRISFSSGGPKAWHPAAGPMALGPETQELAATRKPSSRLPSSAKSGL